MLSIVVETASGAQRRVSLGPLTAGDGETLITIPELTAEPSSALFVWDAATLAYASRPVAPTTRTQGTQLEFRRRVGFARESQLHQLLRNSSLPVSLYGDLTTMLAWLGSARDVNLTDPDTVTQAYTLAAIYQNAGLMQLIGVTPMSANDATTFVAAILTPWSV